LHGSAEIERKLSGMNIKTIIQLLSVIAILGGLLTFSPSSGAAQTTETEDQVTFSMLGLQDQIMHGPYSTLSTRFNAPSSWVLKPGAKLLLNINVSSSSASGTLNPAGADAGASLQISLNDVVLENIFLTDGFQTVEIAIPPQALTSNRLDARHELVIFLNAAIDCDFDHQTTVLIQSSSSIFLPHELIAPELDLSRFPKPIYQPSSFRPENVLILVSETPTASELKAALSVVAGFGRITGNKQPVSLVPIGQLSAERKANSHIIAVGKPESFSILGEVQFPVPVNGSAINAANIATDDGLIQIAHSPWNQAFTVLYVGGKTDVGVVKAAQALTFGRILTGSQSDLAIVSDVSSVYQIPAVSENRSFASLGQDVQTISGTGTGILEYQFYVPPGQTSGVNPYLELVFTHSALMDLNRSGAVMMLNGQSIGSFRFTEESARQVNTIQFGLPDYAIRPGNNQLEIQADLETNNQCSVLSSDGLWMTVSPTSLIHLPLVPVEFGEYSVAQNLSAYPYPFAANPNLAETAIVLPSKNLVAWNVAGSILADLGNRFAGALITLEVVFANAVNDDIRSRFDLLIVGMASELPIIAELNSEMPAPFNEGGNIANEGGLVVNYKIPEGVDMGYLQFLPSPWGSQRAIVAVLGSSTQGLEWAGTALSDSQFRSQLSGNFVVVNDKQIFSSDTRLGQGTGNLSATAVPGNYAATQLAPLSNPPVAARPGWIMPAIGLTTFLILVILFIVIGNSFRQNRSRVKKEIERKSE